MNINILLDGLSLGAIYALIALGYTMVYGIAKMLNFAHGDIIMVGAYAILTTITMYSNPIVALAIAVIVCMLMGILIEKIAYKPLRGASPLAVLITAIGVSYFLQGIAQLIFGAESKPIELPNMGNFKLLGASIRVSSIITLVIGAIIMAALSVFIKTTRTGRAMLAVSEDKAAAQIMGVNVNRIIMITFAIGSALAAFASLFYLMSIPSVTPTLGAMPGIKAFTAAVIGGIGSIPGAMVGGILLGVVENICKSIPFLSNYTTAIEFSLLIIILLVRPIGLLGKKRREKV
ncbi:MAG: branched-chain amino acid ABC transporter permease [Ruminococcaceae bacterium]|nr:branched-chain amino acid ABC transporter permease [Oscillospiraceae bacterium]